MKEKWLLQRLGTGLWQEVLSDIGQLEICRAKSAKKLTSSDWLDCKAFSVWLIT